MSLREAAQQALEALERADNISGYGNNRKAIAALRAAIAETTCHESRQVEPVAYRLGETDIYDFAGWLTSRPGVLEIGENKEAGPMAEAVGEYIRTFSERFTAPPKRKPLTKEQLLYVYNKLPNWGMDMDSISQDLVAFARAVERAHGIGGEE